MPHSMYSCHRLKQHRLSPTHGKGNQEYLDFVSDNMLLLAAPLVSRHVPATDNAQRITAVLRLGWLRFRK